MKIKKETVKERKMKNNDYIANREQENIIIKTHMTTQQERININDKTKECSTGKKKKEKCKGRGRLTKQQKQKGRGCH